MKHFTDLYLKLDSTTKVLPKIKALEEFFAIAHPKDKLWLIALFSGKRPKRAVKTAELKNWIMDLSQIPEWLFMQSYHIVGDLAETISLLIPPAKEGNIQELHLIIEDIIALREQDDASKKAFILAKWQGMSSNEAFIFNKLLTGGFRLGISQKTVVKALSKYLDKDESSLAHRLMGNWSPLGTTFEELLISENPNDDISKPYPFYLAYGLEGNVEDLGKEQEWIAERKWDGIRGQLIKRKGELFVWSRGEELITEKFPEFQVLLDSLPHDCVLDGEILAFKNGSPMNFQELQTRIGRKNISKATLEKVPVVFVAYDILELKGKDLRQHAFIDRRKELEIITNNCAASVIRISESLVFNKWDELKTIRLNARKDHCEGLMLKKKTAVYRDGRKKGDWWKWKIDPLTIDAVLLYAMRGHGRRANLYTDYTFAVWNDDNELVTFTKAYSGLTDAELKEVDRFVKKNTIDRFGPVRSVKPELVFELAFEGIAVSTRHKSGVALRFPRILRWRHDKKAQEANTLQDLNKMLEVYG